MAHDRHIFLTRRKGIEREDDMLAECEVAWPECRCSRNALVHDYFEFISRTGMQRKRYGTIQ